MSIWGSVKSFFSNSSEPGSAKQLKAVQKIINYQFTDINLLRLSLTHRSLVRISDKNLPSNERLEFLGDSVLGLVISEKLFLDHDDLNEGDLTKQKALLVNEITLSKVATELGLHKYILLSEDENRAGGRDRPSIVSDAFEALIGAIFLDGGLDVTRKFLIDCIYSRRNEIIQDVSQQNFKGELLEFAQSQGEGMPRYEVVAESGPDHSKTFKVHVWVNGTRVGEGDGNSKKEAEQKAARMAIKRLISNK